MSNINMDFYRDVAVGSASAISAVPFIQPLIFFKNRAQAGSSRQPIGGFRTVYRGGAGFAASFAPTTAIQTAACGIFSKSMDPFSAATAAGVVSAIAVCPAERIMIQQQNRQMSYTDTVREIYNVCGVKGFYRGFIPTVVREGVFSAAYLGGAPAVKEKLVDYGMSPFMAQLGAGIAVGSPAAILSHPFDTLKTQMQKEMTGPMPSLRTPFAGIGWRVVTTAVATTVMPYVKGIFQSK